MIGRSSFEIVVKPVFDSCDCCVVQGQLVPDGQWILSSGSLGSPGSLGSLGSLGPQGSLGSQGHQGSSGFKNVTCIKGQLYKLEEINELEGNEKFENISNEEFPSKIKQINKYLLKLFSIGENALVLMLFFKLWILAYNVFVHIS